MSLDLRRTEIVLRVFNELAAAAPDGIRPGDVGARLRAMGEPLGSWEIRFALSQLEAAGEIRIDPATGSWHPAGVAAGKRRNSA